MVNNMLYEKRQRNRTYNTKHDQHPENPSNKKLDEAAMVNVFVFVVDRQVSANKLHLIVGLSGEEIVWFAFHLCHFASFVNIG